MTRRHTQAWSRETRSLRGDSSVIYLDTHRLNRNIGILICCPTGYSAARRYVACRVPPSRRPDICIIAVHTPESCIDEVSIIMHELAVMSTHL